MKVAIVCDWLVSVGGAERVLKSISELFPDAPIYTSQYNKKKINWFEKSDVRVGWLQLFPTCFRKFLGPLRQSYFNHLDLSEYELIISVTGAEAKSVKKGNALHLCYCHVPTQYYWGLKDDYLKNPGFGILNPLARLGLKLFLKPLKKADYEAAQKPDYFLTISTYAKEEIKKAYGRESTIIFPPVAVEKFSTRKFSTSREKTKLEKSQTKKPEQTNQRNETISKKSQIASVSDENEGHRYGFVTTSRQVNWKRLDLAVQACSALKLPLTVIGEGPEHRKLVKLAKGSHFINFVPQIDQAGIKTYLEKAEGYIFPSQEPFGIAPVEALSAGCPVIAYGKGGSLDYVIDGENGVLFGKQNVNSLRQALKRFKTLKFSEEKIRNSALPFSEKNFQKKIKAFIVEKVKEKKAIKTENVKPKPEIKQKIVKPAPRPPRKLASAPALKPASKPSPKMLKNSHTIKPSPVKPLSINQAPKPPQNPIPKNPNKEKPNEATTISVAFK